MKIAILGYAGAGKSTLARRLGEYYNAPVLHLDTVQFLPNWQEREHSEKEKIVEDFLNKNSSWIIDGTYSGLHFDRRLTEADIIVMMLFNRFVCFSRAVSRYRKFKGKARPDMTDGCIEKMDGEFIRWVLFGGRIKRKREKFKKTADKYPEKTVIIKTQKQLEFFLKNYVFLE